MALNLDKLFANSNIGNKNSKRKTSPRTSKSEKFSSLRTDPTYTVVLVDESGSMYDYAEQVIQGYEIMLDNFRKSSSTKRGAHYITLALFAEEYEVLQEAEKLSPVKGKDNVILLRKGQKPAGNYNPDGMTALYDCLYDAFGDILQVMKEMEAQGVRPRLNVALISDGEDTMSQRDPTDLRNIVRTLKKEEYLKRSVVLGLLDKGFTEDKLEKIRSDIGFDNAISLNKSAKEFRRAFLEASNIN